MEQSEYEIEALRKQEEEDTLYSAVFKTRAGKKLLGLWVERYVQTWIAEPNATQIGVGIKQGQANFVMMIKKRLERISNGR